jgi:hypothetical protein
VETSFEQVLTLQMVDHESGVGQFAAHPDGQFPHGHRAHQLAERGGLRDGVTELAHLDERLRHPSGIRSLTLGHTKLSYVPDGVATLNARMLLPEPTNEDWAQHAEYLDKDGSLVASVGGLLVERDGRALLIDAGVGP